MKKQINIDIDQKLYDLLSKAMNQDKISKFVEKLIYFHISNQMSELINKKENEISNIPKYN